MNRTPIEWTRNPDGSPGYSVNPLRARPVGSTGRSGHYCEKLSAGCTFCYSSKLQPRFRMPAFGAGQFRDAVDLFLDVGKLRSVLDHRKPTRIFWADMTDMFGAWVPDEWIHQCLAIMALTPQHTHMVLTKRAQRMHDYLTVRRDRGLLAEALSTLYVEHPEFAGLCPLTEARASAMTWPLSNVWLGVSAEDQQRADERIPLLLQTPAAVRFVSAEPLLGPIKLPGLFSMHTPEEEPLPTLRWVIAGSESGPGARPCDLGWVRSLRDQCVPAGVAFFWKQHVEAGRKLSLPALDGKQWTEFPATIG